MHCSLEFEAILQFWCKYDLVVRWNDGVWQSVVENGFYTTKIYFYYLLVLFIRITLNGGNKGNWNLSINDVKKRNNQSTKLAKLIISECLIFIIININILTLNIDNKLILRRYRVLEGFTNLSSKYLS